MTDQLSKVALVTGSSKGIGAAIAKKLAANGFTLALHANSDLASARALVEQLPGTNHHAFQANFSTPNATQTLFNQALSHFGKLNVLINNAGIFHITDPTSANLEQWTEHWQKTMAVNLESPATLSFLAAQHFAKNGGGRIINISSRGAFRGEPNAPAYGASKAGLNALSQSLAQAFGKHHVWVYLIAPGFVETAMARPHLQGAAGEAIKSQSPLHRVASVDEIAQTALFLAQDAPPFMTGAILDVNGASYLRS